jgi:hypothetical protein
MTEGKPQPAMKRSAVIAAILALLASGTLFLGGHKELSWLGFIVLPLAAMAFPGFVAAFTVLNAWHGGVPAWQLFAVAAPVNFLLYWPLVHALRLAWNKLRRR